MAYPLEREVREVRDRRRREPHVITDADELRDVVASYLQYPEFVFDVETTAPPPYSGLHTPVNRVTWIALGQEGRVDVVPVDHPHGNIRWPKHRIPQVTWDSENLTKLGQPRKKTTYRVQDEIMWPRRPTIPPGQVWEILRPLFFSGQRKIGHNVKFDLKTVANANHFGELPPGPYGDTLVLAHILQIHKTFSLDSLVKKVFGYEYQQLGKRIDKVPFSDAANYVFQDVRYTWLLWKRLQEGRALFNDLFDVEMALLEVLCNIERRGCPIDLSVIDGIGKTLTAEQVEVRKTLYRMRGLHEPWNVDSNHEIARWLFGSRDDGGLGIRPQQRFRTKTGADSVSAPALKAYANRREVQTLLRHRELTKMIGTYVEGIRGWVIDGLVNPDHKIHGTATGRLSCATPNLQNIPRVDGSSEETIGMAIRSAFTAPAGHVMLVSDYDQIELRVAAAYSQDKTMLYGFLEGIDPHRMAAATVFGITPDDVTKDQRNVGKTFNFALLYGAGYKRIAATTGMPLKAAERALETFWRGYKGFDAWSRSVVRQARRDRAVWTWLGRERPLPELLYKDDEIRSRAERQAVNTVIQGTAGEIMKVAMLRLHRVLDPEEARIVLTVHDELAVLCRDDVGTITRVSDQIHDAMVGGSLAHFKPYAEEEDDIAVPLTAEVNMGRTWAEAKLG